jgi:hypothetical protein
MREYFTMIFITEKITGFLNRLKTGKPSIMFPVMIFLVICTLSLCQLKNEVREQASEEAISGLVGEKSESEMSAVRFTALPFVLAFKHIVSEREE